MRKVRDSELKAEQQKLSSLKIREKKRDKGWGGAKGERENLKQTMH